MDKLLEQACELMDEMSMDIIRVFEYLCLEGENFNRSNAQIVGWLPPPILEEVVEWLEREAAEDEEDDDDGGL